MLINDDATRAIKVKTELLGRKNGCKIPSIRKSTDKISANPWLLGEKCSPLIDCGIDGALRATHGTT